MNTVVAGINSVAIVDSTTLLSCLGLGCFFFSVKLSFFLEICLLFFWFICCNILMKTTKGFK